MLSVDPTLREPVTVDSARIPHPTARELWLYLLVALLLLFARVPRLLLEGRVLAEEGTTYLRYAWNVPVLHALIAPHQGYYSLFDNLVALLAARVFPLAAAALVFSWSAAAVQLLLLFLAVQCEWLRRPHERLTALVLLLIVTPSNETWLSVENCQSLFPICAGIVLSSSLHRLRALKLATLLSAVLTGPTTLPLVPLFWLRYLHHRNRNSSRAALAQALVLTVPGIAQSLIILHTLLSGHRRVDHQWQALLDYASSRMLVLPFASGRSAYYYDAFLYRHTRGPWALLIDLLFLAIVAGTALCFWRNARGSFVLLLAALCSSAFSWYGCEHCSLGTLLEARGGEGRYFFAANSFLALALVIVAYRSPRRVVARSAGVAVVVLFLSGTLQYFRLIPVLERYPAWLPQVRAWQQDDRRSLLVAPEFWAQTPLHLSHQHPNLHGLPFDAYDSNRLPPPAVPQPHP